VVHRGVNYELRIKNDRGMGSKAYPLFLFGELMELPRATWTDVLLLLCGRRKRFRVEGDSMTPTLREGDVVLIDPNATAITAGDIVLARHPFKRGVKMLKRVVEITEDRKYFLRGDNAAESSDSRSFGAIDGKAILGKVVRKLR
jgi:nickel-type superoxide dismutase maturation protease